MGMAASQARLLSITARLNHIELQSQNISNAKIRLSDDTQEASDAYVKALNKTQYMYNSYNMSGDLVSQNLTGAALTEYGELKNQYGLINSAGQILVSERDAANFQNSNTLEEFLDKYGVLADPSENITIEYVNPVWFDHQADYEKELADWKAKEPHLEDPKYEIPADESANLYNKFMESVTQAGCWVGVEPYPANEGSVYHIPHILTHMLEYDVDYTAYPGEAGEMTYHKPELENGSWGTVDGQAGWNYTSEEIMKEVRDRMAAGEITDKDPDLTQDIINLLYDAVQWNIENNRASGDAPTYYPSNGQPVKSVDDLAARMQDIINRLKQQLNDPTYDEEQYEKDHADWEAQEPVKDETIEKYLPKTVRVATDLDEAQWYVNLWNRMNGVSNFKGGFGNNGAYDPDAGWASKSTTDQSWAVLKDGDMNSPEYLKYAIENGLITLEQVQFKDISSSEQGIKNASWTSIIFTNAQDITEVKDETAIAKAEVEYNKALKEVEIKDKQYDTDLKKLDTEHNALQTEYDSIKTVLDKNVERSFKAFNG